jgi:hypothetical protein
MGALVNSLLQNLWVEMALGCAGGFAIAVLLVYVQHYVRQLKKNHEEDLQTDQERRQRFLLYCADAKVVTGLAMQRHMSDVQFLDSLRAQPCFEALFPFFSEEFKELLNREPGGLAITAFLAPACHAEITRLERAPDPGPLPPFRSFDLQDRLARGSSLTISAEGHVKDDIGPQPQNCEMQKL